MLITFIGVVVAAAILVPLIVTGDLTNFFKRDAVLWGAGLVALVSAVLINLVSEKKFGRVDLTAEGKYSVSPEMKRIIERLGNDEAKVTYYAYSKSPMFEPYKRDMIDKLNEIKNVSSGKVNVEIIDPSENKKLSDELDEKGFTRMINMQTADEASTTKVWSGLTVAYKDKPTIDIGFVHQAEQVEYELGNKLIELTQTKKQLIAIDAPPAPPAPPPQFRQQQQPPGNGFDWIYTNPEVGLDQKKFEPKTIDISETNPIPKDTALLMIIRPKDLNDRQRYEIVKYLAEGGVVFLISAPYKLSQEQFGGWRAERTPSGLEDYLKEAGLTFSQEFLADKSNVQFPYVNMLQRRLSMMKLPQFIRIRPENLDQTTSLTRMMNGLVMPFAVELKLDSSTLSKNGISSTVLAKTTKENWTIPYSDAFDPFKVDEPEKPQADQKAVFVLLKGKFPFPYEGKPVPEWKKEDDKKDEKKDDKKDEKKDEKKDDKKDEKKPELAKAERKEGTLVVCSAPDGFFDQYLASQQLQQYMSPNVFLMRNIAESMSMGDDLMKLRSKQYETRSLAGLAGKTNEGTRQIWKIALIAGVPLLVLIFAIYRFVFRRVRQLNYERNFAGTIGPSSFTS